jgi:F-type H+-transporting ATPase subunit a
VPNALIALLGCAPFLLQEHGAGHGAAAAGDSAAQMQALYSHLSAHRYSEQPYAQVGPVKFWFTNHHAAILVAAALVLLAFSWLARRRRRSLLPRGPIENCLEAMVSFVKDEMVYKNMGEHHGRRFLPLFLSQFFCILVMNLFGVLPNFDFFRTLHFPTTATANLAVTGGLALVTLTTILYAGIKEQGFGHYFVGLAPKVDLGPSRGMKLMRVVILGIMYPIEALGLLIKPVALTVRLFANMTGGHLAMLTVYGLIYVFQSWAIAPVGVAFNVFLTFLELLVALIQAYIFTYLSILFVSASVHPAH